MQVTRDERLAKLQAFSILAVMALVAIAVHFWPSESAVVMTARPVAAARSTAGPERQPAARARMRVSVPAHRPGPRPVASVQAVPTEPPRVSGSSSGPTLLSLSRPALASLPSLPGTSMAMSPAPSPAPSKTGGAVTRAMQTTGKSLAGAFKKTGSAFRRAF
jgi:hypothetical protein